MEVHHHPHVEKKKFKEYFFEFLMIFLAVTLGFFAENVREYFVHKEKEKKYIQSFYEDLSSDEIQLPRLIKNINSEQVQPADSLPLLFEKVNTKTPANKIYLFLYQMYWQQGIQLYVTNRSFTAIQNTGEMRLIANKKISDSLIDYYKEVELIGYLQQHLLGYKNKLKENIELILNASDFRKTHNTYFKNLENNLMPDNLFSPGEKLYLRSDDPDIINKIEIEIEDIKFMSLGFSSMIDNLKNKATRIKKMISENYHIESK